MLSVGSVVLGVADVARARAFWEPALGYRPREEPDDDWVVLVPVDRRGAVQVSLMQSETPPQPRPRVHLDLYADDPDEEVVRLLGLGARRVEWEYPADPDFVVLEDPDGNRFCVIDRSVG